MRQAQRCSFVPLESSPQARRPTRSVPAVVEALCRPEEVSSLGPKATFATTGRSMEGWERLKRYVKMILKHARNHAKMIFTHSKTTVGTCIGA